MSPSTMGVVSAREAFAEGRLEGRAESAGELEKIHAEMAYVRTVCARWRRRHASLGRGLAVMVAIAAAEAAVLIWLAVGR